MPVNFNTTKSEAILAVKELSFDRFIVPVAILKVPNPFAISITEERALNFVVNGDSENPALSIDLKDMGKLSSLLAYLVKEKVEFAYKYSYSMYDMADDLLPIEPTSGQVLLHKRNFFNDSFVESQLLQFYRRKYAERTSQRVLTEKDLDKVIEWFDDPILFEQSLIWAAAKLVNERRLNESASEMIGEQFSDGSGYGGALNGGTTGPGSNNITIGIGDAIKITEDGGSGYFDKNFAAIGSENVLGDKYSFWFKLFLSLRERLELEYGDFSLRTSNVMVTDTVLDRPEALRAYFDSYPFTLSTITRGIITKIKP